MIPTGDMYVNIGTAKSCLFVRMSYFLIRQLEQLPVLYYAVEEALQCAKLGYYAVGIIAFSQLLNALQQGTPHARHEVAHRLLERRPSKDDFAAILQLVKEAACSRYEAELVKAGDKGQYRQHLSEDWKALGVRLGYLDVPDVL